MGVGAPDYFKRILLYGMYDGAAVPLACDEQGRLIFIAEEASPFSHTGTILFRDDFTGGLVRCGESTSGTGASVEVETGEAVAGHQSCKLTGGSTVLKKAAVSYTFTPSAFGKLGVELYFRLGADIQFIRVSITVDTGVNVYTGEYNYDNTAKRWEVNNYDESEWTGLPGTISYLPVANLWNRLKCIFDIENGRYHKVTLPGGEIDATAYNLDESASGDYRYSGVTIAAYSTSGDNGVLYIDGITLTQDES